MNRRKPTNPGDAITSMPDAMKPMPALASYNATSYKWHLNDGGRAASKRPKQRNDCAVRALAIACRHSYDYVYDICAANGRKSGQGFNLKRMIDEHSGVILGLRLTWISFPAQRGIERMNVLTFCRMFEVGRFIVRVSGHYFAVVDGIAQDDGVTYDRRCVYGVWQVSSDLD